MGNELLINIFEDGLFAAIAAIGFSSISNTPRRAYLTCGLIAAAGHAVRYVLMLPQLGGMHIILASTIASFTIGVLAVLFAPRIKCPAEVCFFPALLPMIPGPCSRACITRRKMSSGITSICCRTTDLPVRSSFWGWS